MVARFLRHLLVGQLIFMLLVGWFSFQYWHGLGSAILAACLAMLALRLLITLQNFVIAWFFQSETPAQYKLSPWQKILWFIEEFYATLISSSWLMWRKTFSQRELSHSKQNTLPILLVHGYGCNSGYWTSLSAQLSARGLNHYAIDLEPILAEIDDYVPMLAKRIDAICAATGHSQLIIIAHSMGGLVSRCYLRVHGHQKVAQLITLGTPHNGTGLANFGPGKNSKQMRYNKKTGSSAWLQALGASEDAATRAKITSIFSYHDNIVSPQLSSQLSGANNIAIHGTGHVALALNRKVQQVLLAEIERILLAANK